MPLNCDGAIYAMYMGQITEAIPIPNPPIKRKQMSIKEPSVNAQPNAEMANKKAAINITFLRPKTFPNLPLTATPAMQPNKAELTYQPSISEPILNCAF